MNIKKSHNLCTQAIIKKQLVRPDKCFVCRIKCKPDGHHDDYDKPLAVIWLCKKCHFRLHKIMGKGQNIDGMLQIYIDEDTRMKLISLAIKDFRSITDEIKFLVDTRIALERGIE